MRRKSCQLAVFSCCLLTFVVAAKPASAGVFLFADGATGQEPYIVVHPPGYDGVTGGVLEVRVCSSEGLERMEPAIREAIAMWNAFMPSLENCENCFVWEESLPPDLAEAKVSMSTNIAHELGHCIFGLGHPNWPLGGPPDRHSSFTNTANVASIAAGADDVPGTADDVVSPLPGADVIHWFRKADNDPFAIDGTVIDISTFSRRILDLMALGDNWPVNANRAVGEIQGLESSHSLMYSGQNRGQRVMALAADEVNTVAFGMSGMDETAGTSDDYSVEVIFDGRNCANADVDIVFSDGVAEGNLGDCQSEIQALPGGGLFDIHHVIVPFVGPRLRVRVNSQLSELWDVLFFDGFETGDLTIWSEATP